MNGNSKITGSSFSSYITPIIKKIASIEPFPPVLILGETGVGKGLVAKMLHASSNRCSKPFIGVNCGAIPSTLIESELFGHAKGSFTGANKDRDGKFKTAGEGIIFLDETPELPISLQSTLLHVLEEGTFYPVGMDRKVQARCGLICATHRNLTDMISLKTFREDLYYRINVISILIPPLRKRKEDICELLNYFLSYYCNCKEFVFTSNAIGILTSHDWPGNVRELENFVRRLCALHEDKAVSGEDVSRLLADTYYIASDQQRLADLAKSVLPTIRDEKKVLECVVRSELELFEGVVSKAAETLGMSRSGLITCCNKLKIPFGMYFKKCGDSKKCEDLCNFALMVNRIVFKKKITLHQASLEILEIINTLKE